MFTLRWPRFCRACDAAGGNERHVGYDMPQDFDICDVFADERTCHRCGKPGLTKEESEGHSAGEYARGDVTTNGIESVFAVMKRGVIGTYHHTSRKHLGRYVNEFAFRLNEGNVKRHTLARLDSLVDSTVGKRLTYAGLTHG